MEAARQARVRPKARRRRSGARTETRRRRKTIPLCRHLSSRNGRTLALSSTTSRRSMRNRNLAQRRGNERMTPPRMAGPTTSRPRKGKSATQTLTPKRSTTTNLKSCSRHYFGTRAQTRVRRLESRLGRTNALDMRASHDRIMVFASYCLAGDPIICISST